MGERTGTTLYRSLGGSISLATLGGVMLLVGVSPAATSTAPISGRIAGGILVIAYVPVWVRILRSGIEVSPLGVVVRRYRPGRDIHVGWSEVDHFEIVSNGNSGGYVAVVLTGGRRLTTQGLAVNSMSSRWGAEIIAQMETSRPPVE